MNKNFKLDTISVSVYSNCSASHVLVASGAAIQFKESLTKELRHKYEKEVLQFMKIASESMLDPVKYGEHCAKEEEK